MTGCLYCFGGFAKGSRQVRQDSSQPGLGHAALSGTGGGASGCVWWLGGCEKGSRTVRQDGSHPGVRHAAVNGTGGGGVSGCFYYFE
jgi:hypothetical protein